MNLSQSIRNIDGALSAGAETDRPDWADAHVLEGDYHFVIILIIIITIITVTMMMMIIIIIIIISSSSRPG